MMDIQQTRYILLRDKQRWEGATTTHLQSEPNGDLVLARVPGPADQTIDLPSPFDLGASGIAVDGCDRLYIADTAGNRVICDDRRCKSRIILPSCDGSNASPGHFQEPRGLLVGPPGGLYVADSGYSRVQVFRLPTLEVHAIWEGPLHTPTDLAHDSQNRVYVVDGGLRRVLRFSSWGLPDDVYNARMAGQTDLTSPIFLTIDADDIVYVTDEAADATLRFDSEGQALQPLPSPETERPFRPRALCALAERLYIADAETGCIWVFDRRVEDYLGTIAGYRGPVTALKMDHTGTLYIKPGLDEKVYRLPMAGGWVASGMLTTGPLDAGVQMSWARVRVDAEQPHGTAVTLQVFDGDDLTDIPNETDWLPTRALDTLVPPPPIDRPSRRYLWLRILLHSQNQRATPRLLQVRAETAGETYINHLPAIYQREGNAGGFLRRWLERFRSELGDLKLVLDDMPRRIDPQMVPEADLPWLATWLAFNLPPGKNVDEWRDLLMRVHQLYHRRGTPYGLREFIRLYTGIRPHIIEGFQEQHLWQLGHTSALGFDTALAPAAPNGMVVPDSTKPSDSNHQWRGGEPEHLVVGQAVVGESGPLAAADLGEPLFSDTAHRFTVVVSEAKCLKPAQLQSLKNIIEAEKPAHTDYHLCFIGPRMRVGFQARIGVDSIIAAPPEPMALTGSVLGLNSVLGDENGEKETSRVGKRARVGRGTRLG